MKKKYLYMLTSRDKYELPLVVEDSVSLLARKLNIPINRIVSAMRNARLQGFNCHYVKVEYDEEDD